ncbi:MAG: GAF domain-containing protein [Anaerolineales bacterium]
MKSFFRKILQKKDVETSHINTSNSSQEYVEKKLIPEDIVAEWKLAAPHRDDVCVEIVEELRGIINTDADVSSDKLSRAVQVIHEKFDLYHLGIYIVKDGWLVLYAGAGEAIDRMLARDTKRSPEHGLIGHVATTKTIRCAWDLDPDSQIYFQGPDLGKTNSEIAMPLLWNNKIIGVIDLHSLIRCDFREEEYEIYKMMADCVTEILIM